MVGSSLAGAASVITTVSAVLAGVGVFIVGWIVAVWLVSAALVAVAARHRGQAALLWLLLAVLLTPILAGLMLLLFPDRSDVRRREQARQGQGSWQLCPSCGEAVRREARRCRFCLTDLSPRTDPRRTDARRIEPQIPLPGERVEPRLQ